MPASSKVKITVEINPKTRQFLRKLSKDTNLSESDIIEKALEMLFEEYDADLLDYLVRTSTEMVKHEKILKEYSL